MPENETIISSSPAGNEPTEIGKIILNSFLVKMEHRKKSLTEDSSCKTLF
jgi:hypothetical protein